MTQRDLQALISDGIDAMDEDDMRQETRDLVHLQPPRWRLPIWSAALPGGSQFTATAFSGATSCAPPAWRAAILAADGDGTPSLPPHRMVGPPFHRRPRRSAALPCRGGARRPAEPRTAVERRPYRTMMQAPDGSAVAAVVSSAPPTGRDQERTVAFGAYFAAMAFPFVPSELRGRTAKVSTFPAGSSALGISSVVTPPCGSCPMPALTPSK